MRGEKNQRFLYSPRSKIIEDKRGQFYLIAAVFIVLIMFGTSSVATYAVVKPEPKTIIDLSDELNRETYSILEHGVLNDKDLGNLGDSFAGEDISKYLLKNSEDAAIVFVYGNGDAVNATKVVNKNSGNIVIGGSGIEVNNGFSIKSKPRINGDFAEVDILGKTYSFELKNNEVFYFLIVKERGDEVFIERNKEDKSKKQNRPGGAER